VGGERAVCGAVPANAPARCAKVGSAAMANRKSLNQISSVGKIWPTRRQLRNIGERASMGESMRENESSEGPSPSAMIDARIKELGDWRGTMLARIRAVIRQAIPDVVEEWKWRGVPVWYCGGMICTGETYKTAVKMTFAKGAALEDPSGLFNSSLDGNVRRAIDFHEGDDLDEAALTELLSAAVALNAAKPKGRTK
jgi:hypothetical protein